MLTPSGSAAQAGTIDVMLPLRPARTNAPGACYAALMTRRILLVLAWLALIDIVPTLAWAGLSLAGAGPTSTPLPWFSVIWTLTSLPLTLLQASPDWPFGLLLEGMASLFLALLVPWLLFKLAGRARSWQPGHDA